MPELSSSDSGKAARRGRNSLQEAQSRRTHSRLIESAIKEFAERGYSDTNIEHVLKRAGVSRASFYAHFDGKLSLVCAICENLMPAWRPLFENLLTLTDTSIPSLERWAERYIQYHREYQVVSGLLYRIWNVEARLQELMEQHTEGTIDALGERYPAFAAARVDGDQRLRAKLLLWQIDEISFWVVQGRVADPAGSAARIIAEHIHTFLNRIPEANAAPRGA
ncbi:TetR/AcrR family transcriptional regulator [Brucella anthropi]|uniref:TetR/AcrR family transcriptional regulator n=1 Tax=Brucella anthropi TaxID=529 RepID=UPI0021574663|nr:TetR/AcrR family transcriptional regulator [Brucella anthropi]MCR8492665.1 TetR/AcrR family transcriptional regulator [Brucella anthropi]